MYYMHNVFIQKSQPSWKETRSYIQLNHDIHQADMVFSPRSLVAYLIVLALEK